MKARVESSELRDAVEFVSRSVGHSTALAALSGIKVVAGDGKLTLSTTDIETSAVVSVAAAIDEPGEALPQRRLAEVVKRLPDKPVDLAADDALTVRCGRIEATVSLLDVHDFPRLPVIEDGQVTVTSQVLERVAKHVAPFAAKYGRTDKLFLTGVGVEAEGGRIAFAASDSYRFQKLTASAEGEMKGTVATGLFATGFDGISTFGMSEAHASLDDTERRITSSLIEATYPTIPVPEGGSAVTVEKDALIEALMLLQAITGAAGQSNAPLAQITVSEGGMAVEGRKDAETIRDVIEAVGDEFTFHCNPSFLASLVRTHQAETVTISQVANLKPLLITSDDEVLESVLMPINPRSQP